MFPTALGGSGLWYDSVKSANCANLDDACAYVMSSIINNANALETLINQEANAAGGLQNVFLGGFSQGGQIASYMQLSKLTQPLGGVIVMSGYPLPPSFDWPAAGETAARSAATIQAPTSMNWMIWIGSTDAIFPGEQTVAMFRSIMQVLGASNTLTAVDIVSGQGHDVSSAELVHTI